MKKVRQLLDVVAVAHAVVAEGVAVVPEFLNDLVRSHVLFCDVNLVDDF